MTPIDFAISSAVDSTRETIAALIRDEVIPHVHASFQDGVRDALREELQAAAKSTGTWAPQLSTELGGGGFAFSDAAVLLEEAGTSLLGVLPGQVG